ncbi:hypothetical protein DWW91_15200 [Parabacteroides sp. AF17-3]|nr:hypothetical protein DWW91_15200 [Parabacteroides sp. AF17-3]
MNEKFCILACFLVWLQVIDASILLGLIVLYNQLKDYVKEFVFRTATYESSYIERLEEEFVGFKLSRLEFERVVWRNYIDPDDFFLKIWKK